MMRKVTKESDIKNGDFLKIEALSDKNSYEKVGPVKVLNMENRNKKWIEILINKKENYYFNLTALLNSEPTWGKWVKNVWVYKDNL